VQRSICFEYKFEDILLYSQCQISEYLHIEQCLFFLNKTCRRQ